MRLVIILMILVFISSAFAGEMPPQQQAPVEDVSNEGFGISWGVSAGAAILDGELHNQIGIRPLITIGKLGIALDLSIYLDAEGNIRKENWDEASDIFEKIYYVRWGQLGDPLYVKVGAIDNYRLGYGLLMNRYSNTVEYPSVIRTGLEIGVDNEGFGFQGMVNNFAEAFDGGGVYATRFVGKFIGGISIGASIVADVNQYKGLKDKDNDGVPDFADDFPNNKRYTSDTDGDGQPDELDGDRDGNNFWDNADVVGDRNEEPNFDENLLKTPFRLRDGKDKTQVAAAIDIGINIVNYDYLKLDVYSQYAKFFNDGGWGITAPGVRAQFAFVNAYAEYRVFGEKFIPEYFNTTYELERAVTVQNDAGDSTTVRTKRQLLEGITESLQGYVIGADFNIADFLIFGAEYQDMSGDTFDMRTLRTSLDLNPSIIPKISTAGAYFYQNNTTLGKIFDLTEGTITGYKIGYEIGGGATLLFDFRYTFRDIDGNGEINGSAEKIKSMLIQTVFTF